MRCIPNVVLRVPPNRIVRSDEYGRREDPCEPDLRLICPDLYLYTKLGQGRRDRRITKGIPVERE
jgi:hypothetical protein